MDGGFGGCGINVERWWEIRLWTDCRGNSENGYQRKSVNIFRRILIRE